MAVETTIGRLKQAIDFTNKKNLYFAFARDKDWADNTSPDPESVDTVSLTNPLALLKVDQLVMCYPTSDPLEHSASDGDDYIVYRGQKWKVVDQNNLFDSAGRPTYKANYVCAIGTLDVEALPMFSYTQIGLVEGASILDNAPSQHEASKANVSSWGDLLFYENRQKENYTDSTRKQIKYIIAF